MKDNIILIGFMGSGKSVVGKKLARDISYNFIDMDIFIEKQENLSISHIFSKFGEDYFRKLEKEASITFGKYKNYVIATGGGIIKDSNNIENLKLNSGVVIYLKSNNMNHIYNNLKNNSNRPLLREENKMEDIKAIFEDRKHLYEKYSDIAIDVSFKSIEKIVSEIYTNITN